MLDVLSPLLSLFGLAMLLMIVVVIAKLLLNPKASIGFPYTKQTALFTAAERSFLGVLEQAVGDEYRVFGKVRLADVIKVSGVSGKARQAAFNRIQSKHLDFVVCAADDLSIKYAIELDDRSHAKRKARDQFVDQAMAAARVPLYRFPAKVGYSIQEIRERLGLNTPCSNSQTPGFTAYS